jgi:prevent-host-death family protein
MQANYVGVRELRQNLSVYLERVLTGEVLQVTDRGRPVALLIPLPHPQTTVERLVAAGRATPASSNVVALGRPTHRASPALRAAMREVREDRL